MSSPDNLRQDPIAVNVHVDMLIEVEEGLKTREQFYLKNAKNKSNEKNDRLHFLDKAAALEKLIDQVVRLQRK